MVRKPIKLSLLLVSGALLSACNLKVEVEGDGNVTSTDSLIDCPAVNCSHNYSGFSQTVTLVATPNAGSNFLGYDRADQLCANGEADSLATGACQVKVSRNLTVRALFSGETSCGVTADIYALNVGCGTIPNLNSASPVVTAQTCDIKFDWGSEAKPVVLGYQTSTNWAMRLRANLEIEAAGEYTFTLDVGKGDTGKVVIDGETVVPTECAGTASGGKAIEGTPVYLSAGEHSLEVYYTDDGYADRAVLYYSGPDSGNVKTIVPANAFVAD